MIEQIKQRIRIFCLTCGSALIWLLCMIALLVYMYTIYHNSETLIIVSVYMMMTVVGMAWFGYLVYEWYRRGRDKRSNSESNDLPI